MRPLDITKLNPGIRRTVAWLRENGFDTCDSGDEHAGDRDHAYVVISVKSPPMLIHAANRLKWLIESRGIDLSPVGEGSPAIQANYDPVNDLAFLDLTGLDDAMLAETL